LEVRGIEPLTF